MSIENKLHEQIVEILESLIAPFSFKFAAVNAGIGWMDKNDVLILLKNMVLELGYLLY